MRGRHRGDRPTGREYTNAMARKLRADVLASMDDIVFATALR